MSVKKRIFSLVLTLSFLLAFSGCELFLSPQNSPKQPEKAEKFTPTVFTQTVKTEFETRYYDQLSPNEQHIYEEIVKLSPGETELSLSFPEVPALCMGREPTKEETDKLGEYINLWTANALYAAWLDHPEIFWLEYNTYSYAYELANDEDNIVKLRRLNVSLSLSAGMEDAVAIAQELTAATADFRPPRSATVPEKVAYINNYLCRKITYDEDSPNRGNVIGALVEGRCVCEGYAQAFTLLATKAGLTVANIPGYATNDGKTEGHMWNAVLIDGTFYAVDSTWNDSIGKNEYLLVGKETVCHSAAFGESHVPDMLMLEGPHKSFLFPEIASIAYGSYQK